MSYRLAWFEIFCSILFYYLITWAMVPFFHAGNMHMAFVFPLMMIAALYYLLFVSPKLHQDSLEERGIKIEKETRNWILYGYLLAAGVLAVGVLIAIKSKSQPISVDLDLFLLKYLLYVFSATLQDLFFFSFLLLRIRKIVGFHIASADGVFAQFVTVFLFTVLFGLFHIPNWPLVFFSSLFGFGAAWVFYCHPNLYALIMIHALLGALLHRVYQLHMKIGIFYGNYDPEASFFRKIIPGIEMLIHNRW